MGVRLLEWMRRLSIVLDVVWGLEYFYGLVYKSFIYCDLKLFNILLDDKYVVKVLDFGFVKLVFENNFFVEMRLVGIFGYLVLEYVGESIFFVFVLVFIIY